MKKLTNVVSKLMWVMFKASCFCGVFGGLYSFINIFCTKENMLKFIILIVLSIVLSMLCSSEEEK